MVTQQLHGKLKSLHLAEILHTSGKQGNVRQQALQYSELSTEAKMVQWDCVQLGIAQLQGSFRHTPPQGRAHPSREGLVQCPSRHGRDDTRHTLVEGGSCKETRVEHVLRVLHTWLRLPHASPTRGVILHDGLQESGEVNEVVL